MIPSHFWRKKGPSFAKSLVCWITGFLLVCSHLNLCFSVIQAMTGSQWNVWLFIRSCSGRSHKFHGVTRIWKIHGTRARSRGLEQESILSLETRVQRWDRHCFRYNITPFWSRRTKKTWRCWKALEIVEDLVKSKSRTERLDAVLFLERLMSGTRAAWWWRRKIVRFLKGLVDGSLVGKMSRNLTVHPTVASISDIQPLSETEALSFWDKLSEFWCLSVQDLLWHSNVNFSQAVGNTSSHLTTG